MTARKYDLGAMQQFVDVLDKQVAVIVERSADAKRVADGISAGFKGDAADAFLGTHSIWQTDVTRVVEELKAVREQVAVARENYVKAEQANRGMLG